MLGLVRSAIARARGWVSALSSPVTPKRRERTEARPRRASIRPLSRIATGLVAGVALALAAPSAALAMSAGCSALNGWSGTYTVDADGLGTDRNTWDLGLPIANGEVVTYSWSGNTKGAYVYVMYTQGDGATYAGLIDGAAASGSGSFTTGSTGAAGDFYEVGVQGYSQEPFAWKPSSFDSTVTINVSCSGVPTVTSVSPTAGATGGGNSVTITGADFAGVTAVSFGGVAATTYTVNSTTQITATVPAHAAGTVDVRVSTAAGNSATSAADQYTYIAPPTVTSVSPTAGPTGGGTTVTITGTGFSAANPTGAVKFGATNATYTINSNTQITATSPANSAGTYDITVATPGGTSATSAADQYTYVAAPTVTSVSPTAGPTGGGTTVTITGTGFAAANPTGAVKFGATVATYTINSNTQITATSPANSAGTYDIT
ncbi:IPT/TIG domain-containing protein, partial [Caulobacter sp. 17J65-9]|uniref:IPT/TIG domain-containing protein n=1 Tax=Caulobacter sp. 17J65-9 TaxID=2709382 RepID=UPI00196A03B8